MPIDKVSDRRRPLDPWPCRPFDLKAIAETGKPVLYDLARRMYAEAGRLPPPALHDLPEWDGTQKMMGRFGKGQECKEDRHPRGKWARRKKLLEE